MFGLLVVPASMLFRPFETHPSAFTSRQFSWPTGRGMV
jgi:hypothetical protein